MFGSTAFAQTAAGAAGGGPQDILLQIAPIALMFVGLYFFLLRPQQLKAKKHQEEIAAVKRGDTVVLSSGVLGKVVSVGDAEVAVEIAPKIEVKVVKAMIADVRTRGAPAPANDAKA
jgi:preprotein translocase subunit YajC